MTRYANNAGAFHIEPAPSQPQLAHCHGFFVRHQNCYYTSLKLRARAVRRLPI